MEHFNCDENNALKMFYESHIGSCYADDSTGLYGQSALLVFELFCEEMGGINLNLACCNHGT